MHAQIVADALGVPFDRDRRATRPTPTFVPDSGPTVASRTCMIVGKLLERCARDMRRKLGTLTPAQYFKTHGPFTVTMQYEPPPGLVWDDQRYAGDAYGSFAWGCNVVEVEVDPVTCEVTPIARHRRRGDRQGDSPDDGRRPDRGRHRAGHRLRAASRKW